MIGILKFVREGGSSMNSFILLPTPLAKWILELSFKLRGVFPQN
jgi:hypothetical protein